MRRRRWTVLVSVALTVALCVGYAVADVYDAAPGLLTQRTVAASDYPAPSVVRVGDGIVGDLDSTKTVDPQAASDLIETLVSAEGVGDGLSAIIVDAQGDVVAQYESSTPREPASTMKTLTALAASTTLDMGSTLDTETYLIQHDDGTATLVLTGNGDMLLGEGASDPEHVNGRAGLGTLAERTAAALSQRGITAVTLVYDDTLFGDLRSPEGIEENNGDHLYYTPVSSMAVDGGRQWSSALPKPSNPDDSSLYPPLSQTTAADAAAVFATRLAEQGITVSGGPSEGTTPEDLSPLASVSSATLAEVLAFALRYSDNTLAEEFGRLTAIARGADNSPAGATAAVEEALRELGIDTTGLTMADCSGLTPGSRLTVRTLAAVQTHNLTAGNGAAAAEGLSIAGLVGTAATRYTDESAAGLLRVKTGSLGTVTSMAGNVSRIDGGALSFAVVVNDPTDYEAARSAIDAFVTALVGL
ncbi:D-alanyl-D-alanine carboxypeptidase/D-alanyl-D-alanine-endopeptidase [Bifidobacterium lemurum]|nr:D-alanyl-D-alanine carboxypeptidase [Bifidobacterium lemurum]QOL35329.1 D-alanyl-D-alanine carboxypeptidase [Bifidobacterium lemurum]